MTIKELNELKEYFEAVIKDNDRRALRSDEEEQVLELIDTEIARQSVTDEDVQKHIQTLKDIYPSKKEIVTGEYPDVADALDLAITALQQMKTEGCHSCNGIESHGIKFVKTVTDKLGRSVDAYNTPYHYCPNCSRKLG